jgi:hypothetical protein
MTTHYFGGVEMPITSKSPTVQTRLSNDDHQRFKDLAKVEGLSQADLARKALRWYMENHEQLKSEERDSELVKTIDKMTNRICGMLARQGAEIGTLYELTWQSCPEETFIAALNKTKERLRKRMTKDEQELASKFKKVAES